MVWGMDLAEDLEFFIFNGTHLSQPATNLLEATTTAIAANEPGWFDYFRFILRVYPQFSGYWDNNGTIFNSGIGVFNVSVVNSNGTVLLEINGVDYSAVNVGGDVYSVNVALTAGDYPYRWHSWGNGQSEDYNVSLTRNYTVGIFDDRYPQFSDYWDDNGTVFNSGTGHFNVTILNTNGTVLLEINGENVSATNTAPNVYSVSYDFSSGQNYPYRWHSWGDGVLEHYNFSEIRFYVVETSDIAFPIFLNEWDDNGTLFDSGTGHFNVTILNTNGTVFLNINGTSIVATNLSLNVYSASYFFSGSGDYPYSWSSWGNGTLENYNISSERIYTVKETTDAVYPIFSNYWDDNATLEDSGIGHFNVTVDNTNGTVLLEINGENVSAVNLSSNVYSVSYYFPSGQSYPYQWHSWGNGVLVNYNVSEMQFYTVNRSIRIIDYSGFESGEQGWTFGGLDAYRSNLYSAVTDAGISGGIWSAYLQDDTTSSYFSKSFNFTGREVINLSFYYYPSGMSPGEYVEILCDGNQIWNFTEGDHAMDSWWFGSIMISQADCVFDDSVGIRWDGNPGLSGNGDLMYIDGISLVDFTGEYNFIPEIKDITSVSVQSPVEAGVRNVKVNFSVTDLNGFDDIDSSSARVSFERSGEVTRVSGPCVEIGSSEFVMNYSCSVDMMYYDGAGEWTINVSVSDFFVDSVSNSSTSFTYNQLTAMVMSSASLSWGVLGLSDVNAGAIDDPIVVSNTGNDDGLGINITAYDLQGLTKTDEYIYAANFSVDGVSQGCLGNVMINGSAVTISTLALQRGNNSLGEGQEEIFFCLNGMPSGISSQDYFSSSGWDVRIFMVLLTAGRRKKKEKKELKNDRLVSAMGLIADELKEKYSLSSAEVVEALTDELMERFGVSVSEISALRVERKMEIPLKVFAGGELGALEAVVKYMKENLGMKYSEIGEKLGRDQRTVWTAYKKGCGKSDVIMKFEEGEDSVPLDIFADDRLTVLESIVVYLKRDKKMRYSDIGEILGRDQRNVWGVCARAEKKIEEQR